VNEATIGYKGLIGEEVQPVFNDYELSVVIMPQEAFP